MSQLCIISKVVFQVFFFVFRLIALIGKHMYIHGGSTLDVCFGGTAVLARFQ